MKTIKIAIIEDSPEDLSRLKDCLKRYEQERGLSFEISAFSSGEEFLDAPLKKQLIFLDIELPGMNGIEVARQLRKQSSEEVIVLVTNMVQYAIHGYSIRALDYIVKPVIYEQMLIKMPDFISSVKMKQTTIVIRNKDSISQININMIRYIEVYAHRVLIHTVKGTEECSGTLKEYENDLADTGFVKCSQSCLVNLLYVEKILQNEVRIGNDRLQISRREKKHFMLEFTKFQGGQK